MKDRKRGSGWPSSAHATELVCEVCESAPATVTCKADAAALCATCDADIHTANPLARRHLRLPIHQYMVDNSHKFLGETMNHRRHDKPMKFVIQEGIKLEDDGDNGDYEKEAKSWLLSQPVGNSPNRDGNGLLFSDGEVNGYLDLLHYGESSEANQSSPHVQSEYFENERLHLEAEGNESVVLFQNLELKDHQMSNQQYLEIHLENYSGSFTRSVSMSSLDGSIVPEAVIPEHPSYGIGASNESMELSTGFPTVHIPQYTAMDRKARVLRYREKRKNRKFEKTIRYVSRKAYAETRPRIKGRFAKRTDAGRSRSRPDLFIYTNGGSRIWNEEEAKA